MGLRHLYHLLTKSLRKSNSTNQSAHATLPNENAPNEEPLSSDITSETQSQTLQIHEREHRTDQRRYGQIFQDPDVEAIGMQPFERSTPTANATESTEASFPLIPIYRMRKRGCGGA